MEAEGQVAMTPPPSPPAMPSVCRSLPLKLERDPSSPPLAPVQLVVLDKIAISRFLDELIGWIRRVPLQVGKAKHDGIASADSVWPRAASRHEPTSQELDSTMSRVASILAVYNYGVSLNTAQFDASLKKVGPLIEHGYTIHLCVHQHRDAHDNSSRAARIWQKWYLTIIDWRIRAMTNTAAPSTVPNEWLNTQSGRGRLLVREPAFSGGPTGHSLHSLHSLVKRGRAITYDSAWNGTVFFPPSVCGVLLHRALEDPGKARGVVSRHCEEIGCFDGKAISRAVLGSCSPQPSVPCELKLSQVPTEPSEATLATPRTNLLNLVKGSATAMTHQLVNLITAELGNLPFDTNEHLELASLLSETAVQATHQRASLARLMQRGHFPKQIRTRRRRISIHLCSSETTHLAPERTQEAVIWLTLVDLTAVNPVDVMHGGLLTPIEQPFDARTTYLVPGEVVKVGSLFAPASASGSSAANESFSEAEDDDLSETEFVLAI
jgi:hypothetical protein